MRRVHDFHGGIYPQQRKSRSNRTPIRLAGIPQQLVLPLSQHIGAAARVLVEVGQRVLGGQRLTDLSGLPIHAPTSGSIGAIEPRIVPHASGLTALCIVIDCDGRDEWQALEPIDDYRSVPRDILSAHIFDAGIAGLGGAGFPTALKLPRNASGSIDTLIINGTECEPYITADDLLMRERAAELLTGTEILAYLAGSSNILLGVEDNKPEAIAALQSQLVHHPDIELIVFPTKYPSGGEKQLIEILTGKQVPSGGLPADIGVLCQNVGTAVAVRDAVIEGKPLVSRITTVTGESVHAPGNFEVLLGTPMQFLLEQAEHQPQAGQRLVMGGPLMGVTMPDPQCPIIKTSNCILAPTAAELPDPAPAQACIRCGLCAEACPAHLLPQQLYWYSRSRELERLEEHSLFDCIECGACSYVCPSHIPLVQYYRASKSAIREQRVETAKSEHARTRFEARQARVTREAEEKEARRAARKRAAVAKAAESGSGAADPIQAAIERAKARKAAQAASPAGAGDAHKEKLKRIATRLEKARTQLAQDDGSDSTITAALQGAIKTTEKKLAAARAEEPQASATGSDA
ncbi:MAG: electron transport complex protein RnfC [Halieaceae bacterium]|jgi:electron transport complex protein RnfC